MKNMFIPVLLGTVREGRESEKVANLLLKQAGSFDGVDTELIDIRDIKLSANAEGQDFKGEAGVYRDTIARADGLIVVAPEYNHGYPGSLKRVIDLLMEEYNHKAVSICGVSVGSFGGTRVIEALIPVLREVGLVVTGVDLNFSNVGKSFDADGQLIDEAYLRRIDRFLTELLWMARALHVARNSE